MTIFASAVLGPDGRPFDQIRLTGVTATGHHGVLPHERVEGQQFGADVVLHLDTRPAATGDALADTVSYADVAEEVHAVLAGSPADLVETVAERIAAAVLEHAAVVAVDVRVHKPQAPIAVPFDDVEVAIRRDRVKTPVVPAPEPVETTPDDDVPAATPFAVGAALPAPFPPVPPAPAPMPIPAPVPLPVHAEAVPPAPEPPEPEPVVDRLEVDPVEPVEVVLAIGANLGDPQAVLREAVTDLDRLPGIQVTEVSPLARTTPVGGPEDQPDYLNAVLIARTTLSPRALLRATQAVENAHGRVREERWGPRTLDVDIVRYGSLVASAEDLELPHPRAHERAFVLVPWAEVQPDAELPGLGGGPVAQLAETAPDRAGIRWMALDWLTESSVRTGSYPVADAAVAADAPVDEDAQGGYAAAAQPAAADGPAAAYEAEAPYEAAPPAYDDGHARDAEQPHQAAPPVYDAEAGYAAEPERPAAPAFEPAFEPTFEPRFEPEREPEPTPEAAHPPVAPPPFLGDSGAVPVSPFPRVLPADPVDPPAATPLPVRATAPATPFPPVAPVAPAADPSGRVHTPVSPFAPVRPAIPYPPAPSAAPEPPVGQVPPVVPAPVPPAPVPPAQPPLWQPLPSGTPEAREAEPDAGNDRWIPFDHPDKER